MKPQMMLTEGKSRCFPVCLCVCIYVCMCVPHISLVFRSVFWKNWVKTPWYLNVLNTEKIYFKPLI